MSNDNSILLMANGDFKSMLHNKNGSAHWGHHYQKVTKTELQ